MKLSMRKRAPARQRSLPRLPGLLLATLLPLGVMAQPADETPASEAGGRMPDVNAAQGQNQSQNQNQCQQLPDHSQLSQALVQAVAPADKDANGGLGNHMWAVLVDKTGTVCSVTYSGDELGQQWPGSRGIAASKAFTAFGFSLPDFALSTANIYWPAQPNNSLYGIASGNPIDPQALYRGPASSWGSDNDPLVGSRAGGAIAFGGGLALYNEEGELLGGLGLSGDESCTDHVIAWKVRHQLNLDNVPKGVTKTQDDNIIYDLTDDPKTGRKKSASGYGHPICSAGAERIAENFPETHPTGPEE